MSETRTDSTAPVSQSREVPGTLGATAVSGTPELPGTSETPRTPETSESPETPEFSAPRRLSTREVATDALLVALLVVSCFFTIPVGPVPFTLQTAVVILIALLCDSKHALIVCGLYLLMGACGLPVFSSMTGGIGKILGPTGGFLVSFVIGAPLASALRRLLERRGVGQLACDVNAVICIIVVSDILGLVWYMVVASVGPLASFLAVDAPFLAIDCLKGALAIAVATAVRRAVR